MGSFDHMVRRLKYGKPIVVVSGLPRSGTSMAMKMLEAGGMPILADGIRTADISNPKGYYEFEPVKELDKGGDVTWLAEARGKAVKIISFLLTWLPERYDYRVIFMQRDLREAIASQNAMLAHRGETPAPGSASDDQIRKMYEDHLQKVTRFMANRPCFSSLTVGYREVVENPRDAAGRIDAFLGGTLDVERMAAVADPSLYRNRRQVGTTPGERSGPRAAQMSRFWTSRAFFSMKSRRGSTWSPISTVKISSVSTASSMRTCSSVRVSGFMVVSQSCSGFISPKPL